MYKIALALDGTVLPLATSTLEVAEQIRCRLMGAHRRRIDDDRISGLFSGKDESGAMRLDHGHLYILPQANGLGRIHRILLMSRVHSFKPDELDAVRGVLEIYQSHDRPKVRCVIAWQGKLDEPANDWESAAEVQSITPFVTMRHMRRGRDLKAFLEDEIRRECRHHGLPEPVEIERLPRIAGLFDVVEYRRNRKDDPARPGYSFRLRFAAPVTAPFALGYASHFGLGQFRRL